MVGWNRCGRPTSHSNCSFSNACLSRAITLMTLMLQGFSLVLSTAVESPLVCTLSPQTPVWLSNGFRFKDSLSLDSNTLLLQLETVDTTLSSKSSGFWDYRGWIQKPDISQGLHGHPPYYCPLQGIRTKERCPTQKKVFQHLGALGFCVLFSSGLSQTSLL